MLRERVFAIGAGLLAALGAALIGGLAIAGAGWGYYPAYLAGALAFALGALFYQVAREARQARRALLESAEVATAPPAGPPRR